MSAIEEPTEADLEYLDWMLECQEESEAQLRSEQQDDLLDLYRNEY